MTREEAVQEVFLNFKDLVGLFAEHKLEAFATAEVVQALAQSAFKYVHESHRNGPAAPANVSADGWIKGKIEQKEVKKTTKGTDMCTLTINGTKYSTFDKKVFGGRVFNQGDDVEMRVEQDGKFWNIKEVKGAEIPF